MKRNKEQIMEIYKYWVDNSPEEVSKILKSYDENTIQQNFYSDISFGTAGIREIMTYGTNKINEFVISGFAYSFGKVLISLYGEEEVKKRGVVITHDNRKNGKEYSYEIASVLSGLGIKAYLFSENSLEPTPLLSYTTYKKNFIAGVNVTASHNPKEYSGVKFYSEDGKQIDTFISDKVREDYKNIENIFNIEKNDKNIFYLDDEIINQYLNDIFTLIPFIEMKDRKDLKVVFGANHGTSTPLAKKVLDRLNVDYIIDEKQSYPSETFENVKYPNPQDVRSFERLQKIGDENNADVLFAVDPDADRFGIMVKHNSKWEYINGNQLPAIQIFYKLNKLNKLNYLDKKKHFFVRSLVSSKLSDYIIKDWGLEIYETLTGFKSIIEKALAEEEKGKECLFAWEESNGSVVRTFTRDKDSFQALYQVTEMIYEYKTKGQTLVDVLEEIYDKYGYMIMDQKQIVFDGIEGQENLDKFISKYRDLKVGDKLFGYDIEDVVDMNKGYKEFPKQNILFIYLKNNSFVCLRPSGTEPILRIYFDIKGDDKEDTKDIYDNLYESL